MEPLKIMRMRIYVYENDSSGETDENIAAEKDNFDSDSVSDSIIEK